MENEQKSVETNLKDANSEQKHTQTIDVPIIENMTKSDIKKKTKGLRGKKKLMIINLIKKWGVVKYACLDTGISRETHYRWLKEDERYKETYESLEEDVKDRIQTSFFNLIANKNPQAIIHAVKTKLRDRGYGDYLQTEDVSKTPKKITLEIINENPNDKNIQPPTRIVSTETDNS